MKKFFLGFKLAAIVFLGINIVWSRAQQVSSSYLSDRETGGLSLAASSWVTYEDAVDKIAAALVHQPSEIFSLLSLDLQQTFSQSSFDQELDQKGISIVSTEVISEVEYIGDEWAEFTLRLILEDESRQEFLVVLFKEGGEWRIFGTVIV